MDTIRSTLSSSGFKRFLIFGILVFILYLLRSMLNVILLTFIVAYLIDRIVKFFGRKYNWNRYVVICGSYIIIILGLTIGITKYLPIMITQILQLMNQLESFYTAEHTNPILNYIFSMIETNNISSYIEQMVAYIVLSFSNIGKIGVQIFISIILSFFFLIEKPRLIEFTSKFENSKIAPFYREMKFFGTKFVQTFGKVIEAQVLIATVNCVLTTIVLWILGFPQLMGLSIMVFFLGLIPVAGVIISLIPLCTIAFTIGGIQKVIIMIVWIMVIHALEAYILNPKFMSSKTNLPIFYTFIVLIFGEHFFGIWGLIVGIPVFVFILDVLGVDTIGKIKKKKNKNKNDMNEQPVQ